MATNTPSQAASIDTPEFRQRLATLVDATHESFYKAIDELIAHIDAKLAQAFNDGAIKGRIHQSDRDNERIQAAESRAEKAEQYAQVALGINDSLENRLAEIQRGVESFIEYVEKNPDSIFCTTKTGFQSVLETLGRLTAQPIQSDTSGISE